MTFAKNLTVKVKTFPSFFKVKIVDSNNRLVPLGVRGEICVRGYQVMLGYWNDENATKEAINNGWYPTG